MCRSLRQSRKVNPLRQLRGKLPDHGMGMHPFLIQKALTRTYDSKLVQTAAKLLHYTKGQCRIEELADYCHASVRHTKHDTYPDGKEFVGVGVQPNKLVVPTIADLRANRDTVLEAALAEARRLSAAK
jgi:hypothetical protein